MNQITNQEASNISGWLVGLGIEVAAEDILGVNSSGTQGDIEIMKQIAAMIQSTGD